MRSRAIINEMENIYKLEERRQKYRSTELFIENIQSIKNNMKEQRKMKRLVYSSEKNRIHTPTTSAVPLVDYNKKIQ